jgi:hypothetical protein
MYRPARPTWKISKPRCDEIREIHRTIPVMHRGSPSGYRAVASGQMSGFERSHHENSVTLSRALNCRYPVHRDAVRPRWHGLFAGRQLPHDASERHGCSAEAVGQAAQAGRRIAIAAGGKIGGIAPDFPICSNDGTCSRSCHGKACRARENLQQLHRRLSNKLQIRQPTVERMLHNGRGI